MRAPTAALVFALCACGARTGLAGGGASMDAAEARDAGSTDMRVAPDLPRPHDMFVAPDLPPPPDLGPPTTCAGSSGPTSSTVCTQRVRMGALSRSSPSCFVDVRPIEGEEGTLRFDCSGGGAELVFDGGARFVGISDDVRIDVCSGTEFDWADGCHWESAQHVAGSRLEGFLTLTYNERAAVGTGGQPPCSASAVVSIE